MKGNKDELISIDYSNAAKMFLNAEIAGATECLDELANLFEGGIGVNQNFSRAFNLYKKSSLNNDFRSMIALARFYSEGIYVEKNIKKAYLILNVAGSHEGLNSGSYNIEYRDKYIVKPREFLAKILNKNDLIEAQKLSELCSRSLSDDCF